MFKTSTALACLALCSGLCAQTPDNGAAGRYEDPASPGQVRGVGLESQDIVAVSDEMVRDILADPEIVRRVLGVLLPFLPSAATPSA